MLPFFLSLGEAMKIIDKGNIKEFTLNMKKYNVKIYENKEILINDTFPLENIEEMYYFINGLTEIAKKLKEEIVIENNKINTKKD